MQYLKDEGFDVAKISKSFLAKISSVISAVVDTEEDGAFLCNEREKFCKIWQWKI